MMRGILSLALVVLTAAQGGGQCQLDSADTVQHGISASLAIWASTKRCHGAYVSQAPVKCVQDVTTSIAEITAMGSAISAMIGDCGGLADDETRQCGIAATDVVSASAALAAASAAIADKCGNVSPAALSGDILDTATDLGKCTADAGASMNSVFQAHGSLQQLMDSCKATAQNSDGGCTVSGLDITSVLANFGSFIATAYVDCSAAAKNPVTPATNAADCAGAVLAAVAQLTELSKLGLAMKDACAASNARLYLDAKTKVTASAGNPLVLALAAILPISAVLSFVAGSRFAKSRQNRFSHVVAYDDAELPMRESE